MSSDSGSKGTGAAHPDPLLGSVLSGRYRVDHLLGAGGMGKVYAAEHVWMKKKLAIKILHRELCQVEEVIARFEREAMASANIDHPNVAAATDFGRLPDGSMFLALEFVEGRSLRDELVFGPMPLSRVLHIARQVALGLAAAHAQGIVHRDLKPENVMLTTKGDDRDCVKVLDFGVAKFPAIDHQGALSSGPLTKAGMVFGTPEYMAPEQALAQGVDGRADLYALGVITFEMLSGAPPYSGTEGSGIVRQQLTNPPPTLEERVPGILLPTGFPAILERLLAREAAARFQSARELVAALDALLMAPPAEAPVPRPVPSGGAPTVFLGSPPQAPETGPAPPSASSRGPLPPAPAPPRPEGAHAGQPGAAQGASSGSASLQAVIAKPGFLPGEPLPAFTFPALPEGQVKELQRRVAEVRAEPAEPRIIGARGRALVARLLSGSSATWTRCVRLVARGVNAGCRLIDDNRSRLPSRLRHALRNTRAGVILGVLVGLTTLGFVLCVLLVVGPSDSEAALPANERSETVPMIEEEPVLEEIEEAK